MSDNNLNNAIQSLLSDCSKECITGIESSISSTGDLTLAVKNRKGDTKQTITLPLSNIIPKLKVNIISEDQDASVKLEIDDNTWNFIFNIPKADDTNTMTWDGKRLVVTTNNWSTNE